jgi:hypothetical protein
MDDLCVCPSCQRASNRAAQFCAFCGRRMGRPAGDESRRNGFFRVVTLLVVLWGLGSGVWGLTRSPGAGVGESRVVDDDGGVVASQNSGQILGVAPIREYRWNASDDPRAFYYVNGQGYFRGRTPGADSTGTWSFGSFERQMRDSRWYPRWLMGRGDRR